MALTYQEVEAACSVLEQQGTKLSTRNVREYIGSGSLTTISRYLQKRREQNKLPVQQDRTAVPLFLAIKRVFLVSRYKNKLIITDDPIL